jgi:hypothetical protein
MQTFVARLVRDYDFELPEQDLTMAWNRIPPEPRGGLRFLLRVASTSV